MGKDWKRLALMRAVVLSSCSKDDVDCSIGENDGGCDTYRFLLLNMEILEMV